MDRSLLFTRTKHGAKKLAKQLSQAGIPVSRCTATCRRTLASATSNRSPRHHSCAGGHRHRARGIHVDDIALVIHVDPRPSTRRTCTARSHRRAGAEGVVVS